MRSAAARIFALFAGLAAAAVAADDRVLHEFVQDVDPDEAFAIVSAHQPSPDAIVQGGEVLEAPEPGAASAPPMVATQGDGAFNEAPGQRSANYRPDRITELEGTLTYHAAFTPSIAPFKRVTSLDAVRLANDGVTPWLTIRDPRTRAVAIEGADAAPPDGRPRDRFWGQATLDFSAGARVPLPSVSPESRILSVRSEPDVDLAVERDGADNFFAVYRGKRPPAQVFVTFLTDAPRSYFAAELPDAPVTALASQAPPLDPKIRARGLRFAKELGIDERSTLKAALIALTAHFRAFEESAQPPEDTGDVYLDLARGKKGVCRHRAYAFMVTALALGIPTRFVQNEAHSWVEVKLPGVGFMRIDLGGAANGLQAQGAEDKPLYQQVLPDPLPRPAAYRESYSLLGRNASGFRRPDVEQLQGRWVEPAATQTGSPGARTTDAAFLGGPSPSAPLDQTDRAPLAIRLAERRFEAQRGASLPLRGAVQGADGAGVAGLRIEVSLAAEHRKERLLLGVTVSDERGEFGGDFGIPGDLPPGDYRLVVVTPGSDRYLPAIAE